MGCANYGFGGWSDREYAWENLLSSFLTVNMWFLTGISGILIFIYPFERCFCRPGYHKGTARSCKYWYSSQRLFSNHVMYIIPWSILLFHLSLYEGCPYSSEFDLVFFIFKGTGLLLRSLSVHDFLSWTNMKVKKLFLTEYVPEGVSRCWNSYREANIISYIVPCFDDIGTINCCLFSRVLLTNILIWNILKSANSSKILTQWKWDCHCWCLYFISLVNVKFSLSKLKYVGVIITHSCDDFRLFFVQMFKTKLSSYLVTSV